MWQFGSPLGSPAETGEPDGTSATAGGGAGFYWPGGGIWGTGVASHTFTVLSHEALARRLPSGLKHTPLTSAVCPVRVTACWPVAASHTFTVPSAEALARRLPSWLKLTPLTLSACPLRVRAS